MAMNHIFQCSQCGAMFSTRYLLAKHGEINHAKKICMVKKLEEKDEITTPRIHEESK